MHFPACGIYRNQAMIPESNVVESKEAIGAEKLLVKTMTVQTSSRKIDNKIVYFWNSFREKIPAMYTALLDNMYKAATLSKK